MAVEKQIRVDVEKYNPPFRGERASWYVRKLPVTLKDDVVEFQNELRINIHDLRGMLVILEEENGLGIPK